MPFPLPGPGSDRNSFFKKSFLRRLRGGEEGRVGKATKRATQKESRVSRGFLVNLATAARESTSSRDALPPPLLSPGPRSPGAPIPFSRRRRLDIEEAGVLTCRPRPTRTAARGCNGPAHRQRKGKRRQGSGVGAGSLQHNWISLS